MYFLSLSFSSIHFLSLSLSLSLSLEERGIGTGLCIAMFTFMRATSPGQLCFLTSFVCVCACVGKCICNDIKVRSAQVRMRNGRMAPLAMVTLARFCSTLKHSKMCQYVLQPYRQRACFHLKQVEQNFPFTTVYLLLWS